MRIFLALLISSLAYAQSPSPRPILINDFGAVPDCVVTTTGGIVGGTDAGPAFNQAIDQWAARGGTGTVSATAGNYCVFSPVVQMTGGASITITGELGARLFVYTPAATTFTFTAKQSTVKDIVIAGNQVGYSTVDTMRLIHAVGDITLTVDNLQVYGVYAYDSGRNGAIVGASVNQLNVKRSGFWGTCAHPYGGAVVGPAVHVDDVVFQDYGGFNPTLYEKTWNEPISWVLCTIAHQTTQANGAGQMVPGQSFGAARRAGCTVERSRFDEGAKWAVYAVDAATSLLPGARRQRVVVRDSAFMVPAQTQGRAINIKDTDDVIIEGNHFAIRWDEPAISCYGCGDVRISGVGWRPLGAADGWPNTPPGLILKILADPYTRSLDVRNVGGAIVQAGAPTLVRRDGGLPLLPYAPANPWEGLTYINTTTVSIDAWVNGAWRKAALQ